MKKLILLIAFVPLLIPGQTFAKGYHAPKIHTVHVKAVKIAKYRAPKIGKSPAYHAASTKSAAQPHYAHIGRLVTGWGNNI